jgi:DNA-directed RNA polymerase specialized sigma24 family protein
MKMPPWVAKRTLAQAKRADREALARALETLLPDHQLVVHLRLVEGYSFAEVARLTGRSVGACQMLMLRSARRLRSLLEQEGIRVPA